MYSDRTKRNFAVNVPEINTKTKEKNEANRQYEEHLNNYHASFENSPICLFKRQIGMIVLGLLYFSGLVPVVLRCSHQKFHHICQKY